MGFSAIDSTGSKKVTGGGTTTVVTSTSTGTQNDFAPGISGTTLVRLNNASTLTITGLASGTDGQQVTFVSIGAGDVLFQHQNAGSSAANRLINIATSIDTPLVAGVGTATFRYDATTARWRLVQHEMGGWRTYVASWKGSSSDPAIGNGSLLSYYMLRGRMLFVGVNVAMGSTTTFGSGFWYVTVPVIPSGGIGTAVGPCMLYDDSGVGVQTGLCTYTGFGSGGVTMASYLGNVTPTSPQTWAVNDQFRIFVEYSIA